MLACGTEDVGSMHQLISSQAEHEIRVRERKIALQQKEIKRCCKEGRDEQEEEKDEASAREDERTGRLRAKNRKPKCSTKEVQVL